MKTRASDALTHTTTGKKKRTGRDPVAAAQPKQKGREKPCLFVLMLPAI
jgi:hypothetical protein